MEHDFTESERKREAARFASALGESVGYIEYGPGKQFASLSEVAASQRARADGGMAEEERLP